MRLQDCLLRSWLRLLEYVHSILIFISIFRKLKRKQTYRRWSNLSTVCMARLTNW
jgi:hypothetical protein